jgi:hypothetical protein
MAKEEINLGLDFSNMIETDSTLKATIQNEPEEVQSEDTSEGVIIDKGDISGLEENKFNVNDYFKEENIQPENKEKNSEESKVVDKAKSTSSKSIKDSSSNVPFSLVFKSLQEEDALSDFDEDSFNKDVEEVGEAKAIRNVFLKEADVLRQVIQQETEEDFKEYTKLLDLGIGREEANKLISQKLEFSSLKEEDLEKEENAEVCKSIIIQNLKNTTKLTDLQIKKQIDRADNAGELVEDAKEALKEVNTFAKVQVAAAKEKAIQDKQLQDTARKEAIQKYKDTVASTDEIIPGQKINKQTKTKVEDAVLNGMMWEVRKKDPYKFDTIVNYLALTGLFEGKGDKLTAKAKTSAIEELEKVIKTTKKSEVTPNTYTANDEEVENDSVTSFLTKRRS